jgi:hypothetical protein
MSLAAVSDCFARSARHYWAPDSRDLESQTGRKRSQNPGSDVADGLLKSSADQANTHPMIGPLANNGGPTLPMRYCPEVRP